MRAPTALRIYALTVVVPYAIGAVFGGAWDAPAFWIAAAIVGGLIWALLRGSRVAWVLLLALEAAILVTAVIVPPAWWAIALSAVALVCLLAPSSRRFVWVPRERPEPRHTGDPWGVAECR